MKRSSKIWSIAVLAAVFFGLAAGALMVWKTDPFFQYRAMSPGGGYGLNHPDYTNPGIAKNWEYDALITGSSMVQNFKVSWFEEALGVRMVKLGYAGGRPKNFEIILDVAFSANPEIDYVIYGLDASLFGYEPDTIFNPLPEYLYDGNPLNDLPYLLNKTIYRDILTGAFLDRTGMTATEAMDAYTAWHQEYVFSKDAVLEGYQRPADALTELPEGDGIRLVEENLRQNLLPFIERYPDTEFHIFFPPYSILFWDAAVRKGTNAREIFFYRYVAETLMRYENVKLFSFFEEEIITDLDNYKDYIHYSMDVTAYIAGCMIEGKNQLTRGNYESAIDDLARIVETYPYDELFAG